MTFCYFKILKKIFIVGVCIAIVNYSKVYNQLFCSFFVMDSTSSPFFASASPHL